MATRQDEAMRSWIHGVRVGADDTDHLDFFCPRCQAPMWVQSVQTTGRGDDKVTRIRLGCDDCGAEGQRKTYWNAQVKTPNRVVVP